VGGRGHKLERDRVRFRNLCLGGLPSRQPSNPRPDPPKGGKRASPRVGGHPNITIRTPHVCVRDRSKHRNLQSLDSKTIDRRDRPGPGKIVQLSQPTPAWQNTRLPWNLGPLETLSPSASASPNEPSENTGDRTRAITIPERKKQPRGLSTGGHCEREARGNHVHETR